MNIIIIDKNSDIPDWMSLLNDWKEDFQERGHYVDGPYKKLTEGDGQNTDSYRTKDLGKYQIAIAHPELGSPEVLLLDKEVKKRPDFKVIFYSGDYEFKKKIEIRQSNQVYYEFKSGETFSRIIELVEKGW